MYHLIKYCLLWFLIFHGTIAFSQSQQDVQLAQQYFKNAEYDKAAAMYEKLVNKAPENQFFYENYIQSLIALKRYGEAEKYIKKQIKRFPADLSYYVELGNIKHLQGDEKSAAGNYEEAIRLITTDMEMVNRLAFKFQSNSLDSYAIEAYLRARKIFNAENSDLFKAELASLYRKQGDVSNAVKSYLDIIEFNPTMADEVEGQLQPFIESADFAKELQAELYRRIQKRSEIGIFGEMLIWYYIQKKILLRLFCK